MAFLLVAGIYYGSIIVLGKPVDEMDWPGTSLRTIIANLTYSYSILDAGKYIDVYWTLEVEFQYYILIAFLLPPIVKYSTDPFKLSLLLIILSSTFLIHNDTVLFFRDNSFFILGILLFLYKSKKIDRNYFVYASMTAMIICYAQQVLSNSFAAIIAFLIIAFVRFQNPITTFIGKISYSLYITYFFSWAMEEFFLKRITGDQMSDPVKVVMLFVYTGIAILFAWLFYLAMEKPFIRLSQMATSGKKPFN